MNKGDLTLNVNFHVINGKHFKSIYNVVSFYVKFKGKGQCYSFLNSRL